ncbi:MAG: hypothetical protein RRC34_02650 [Lentisphaeria bacterium]|nr:hypothetical protein [Lentisphaeria bacterium]
MTHNSLHPLKRSLFSAALILLVCAAPVMSAWAAEPTASQPQSSSFLGQVGDGVTGVHDNLGYDTVNKVLTTEDNFKYIIKEATQNTKYIEAVEKAGKYAKVIDLAFKAVKFGNLSIECKQALDTGDREGFKTAFNTMMKEIIKTAVSSYAATAGGTQGGIAGFALGGPIGAAVGGIIGAIGGGYVSSEAADYLYEKLLADFIKGTMSDAVFDSLSGQSGTSGAGGGGPPLLPQPGGGNQSGNTGVLPAFR